MAQVEMIYTAEPGFQAGEEVTDRRISIRVHAFDPGRVEFSEDTFTYLIHPRGAHIALRNCVVMGDFLRIVNLENYCEADFKIIGPKMLVLPGVSEWVVECVDQSRNIWGLPVPVPSTDEQEGGPLLACRACESTHEWPVTELEMNVLDSTGMIVRDCERCRKPTYWIYEDPKFRPPAFPPFEDVAPPPRELKTNDFINTRKHRRLALRMATRVRQQNGQVEISSTENISTGGFASILKLDMQVGERVVAICPYMADGQNIEQQAECRWGTPVTPGGSRKIYGFRFLDHSG
jgi:PilZ domain